MDTQLDAATSTVAVLEHGRGERNPKLQEATRCDLDLLDAEPERRLAERLCFCGDVSLPDIAVAPHIMAAAFLGFPLDPAKHSRLTQWMERVQERESIVRDDTDVFASLQRSQEEGGGPGFDPYRVQWRSDRLEWVIKNGLADWLNGGDAGRAGVLPADHTDVDVADAFAATARAPQPKRVREDQQRSSGSSPLLPVSGSGAPSA